MHFSCRSFLGSQTDANWSLYWENEPDDLSLVSRRGHLFGIINLHSDSEVADISALGHQLIDSINESYYSSANINLPIADSLRNSLANISGLMSQGIVATVLIMVVNRQQLYFALLGPGQVIIKRQQQISRLLTSTENQTAFLSGPLSLDDDILLLTERFNDSIGWEKIKSILSIDSVIAYEENFLASVYSVENQAGLAAALVRINSDPEDLEAVAPPPPPPEIKIPQPSVPPRPIDLGKPHFKFNPLNFIFRRSNLYVSPTQVAAVSRRKRFNIILALLLLTALVTSAYFGFRKNQADRTEKKYQALKTSLTKSLNSAAALRNLDLDNALNLANDSQDIINQMLALKIHPEEVSELQKQLTGLKTTTGSSDHLAPEFLYDTSNITTAPNYSSIYQSQGKIYLLDTASSRLDSLDLSEKSITKLSNDSKLKNIISFTLINGKIYLSSSDTIYLLDGKTLASQIDLSTLDQPVTPVALRSWQGSLYLLDSKNLQIWKFAPTSSSFGKGQKWLKNNLNVAANPVSMSINGSIWVISGTGQLTPYNRGQVESFTLTQEYRLTQTGNLITTADSPYLVFSDSGNMVYVIKKSGESQAKYNLGNLRLISLALNDSADTIYLLCADQKIYKISL